MKSSPSLIRLAVSSLCLCFSIVTPFAQTNTQKGELTTFKTRKVIRDGMYDVAIIANFTYHEQYPELQKYVSKRLFKMENPSLQVAYENYANTLGSVVKHATVSSSGQAEFYKVECLGGLKDYYQNYVLSYSKDRLDESDKNMKTRSLSRNFIFDVQNKKVLTLDDVFVPEKAEELKTLMGKSSPKMTMDGHSIIIGYKKDGKQEKVQFIYKTQKSDFADSFKQLVDSVEKITQANALAEAEKLKMTEGSNAADSVEQMPTFKGGVTALMQYLNSSIKYPVEAEENGIQGRVVTSFVIETDGSVTDVKVTKSIHPALDKEAIRVVKSMPKWNPGMQNGKPVRTKFFMPVTFGLH